MKTIKCPHCEAEQSIRKEPKDHYCYLCSQPLDGRTIALNKSGKQRLADRVEVVQDENGKWGYKYIFDDESNEEF